FGITSIPTLMIIRDNVVLYAQPGALPAAALNELITKARELDMDEVRASIAEHEDAQTAAHEDAQTAEHEDAQQAGRAGRGCRVASGGAGRLDQRQWDELYASAELVWTAEPNRFVAEELAGLAAGRALDLGTGEGRNAIWLAERGWQVTAVDFSAAG